VPFYEFDVTSPANTPASAPTEVRARLQKGVIVQWEVAIPPGVQGLTGSYVERGGHQIVPANPDSFLKGDDDRITWQDAYQLLDEPTTLSLFTWNLDDSYPHTVTFRINVLPLAQAEASVAAPGLLRRISEFLGVGQ
jgi:hypothetical protein